MTSDRYFLNSPKASYDHFSSSKKIVATIEVIALIYGIALFSLYWFLWRPSFDLERASFKHSPTLFFAAVWIIGSASSIGYAIWKFISSNRMVNELQKEADELGKYLYKVESDLQEQLETLRKESEQSPPESDYHSKTLLEGREVLWEKYDALLE